MDLANRLRRARERKGYSQTRVAEILGVGNKSVSTWETGRAKPSVEIIRQLADIYDVTVEYLLNGKPSNTTPQDEIDLKKVLEESALMFDGVPLSDADKEQVKRVLQALFWESRESK